MELPVEIYPVMTTLVLVAIGLGLVHYWTRNSRNFRSSRNRKARRQS